MKKTKGDLSFIRCDKLVFESGKEVFKFYPDKTMRNLFERVAYEDAYIK